MGADFPPRRPSFFGALQNASAAGSDGRPGSRRAPPGSRPRPTDRRRGCRRPDRRRTEKLQGHRLQPDRPAAARGDDRVARRGRQDRLSRPHPRPGRRAGDHPVQQHRHRPL